MAPRCEYLGGLTHVPPDHHRQNLYRARRPTHDRIAGAHRTKHILQDLSTCSRMPAAQEVGPCGSPQEEAGQARSGQMDIAATHSYWSSIAATYSAGYIGKVAISSVSGSSLF